MKKISHLLAALVNTLVFAVFLAIPAQAVFFQTGDYLELPKEKKIDETAFVSGNSLTVNSSINGDLLCAGKDVTINGDVSGDILCAGQTIKINGNVDGDVRVAGQTVEINGLVGKNVYTLSQNFTLTKFSSIKGDIFYGVQMVDLRGSLGRDMLGAAEQINISGSLLRNAKVTAQNINVTDPAKIGGEFEYYMEKSGMASVSAKNVKGSITRHDIVRDDKIPNKEVAAKSLLIFGKIFSILSYFVLGLALIYFLKRGVVERIHIINQKPFVTGLIGFAALILTPIVAVLLMITLIGMPLAFIVLFEYVISLITAAIYPAIMLGKWLVQVAFKNKKVALVWSLAVGVLAMGLLTFIPVIGGVVGFVAMCLGLGAIFVSYLPSK